jgi:hypothetical protein
MKVKVTNRIPGKKAKAAASVAPAPSPAEEAAPTGEAAAEPGPPETRENPDDKHSRSEARKAFDAEIRSKLKYSRKR